MEGRRSTSIDAGVLPDLQNEPFPKWIDEQCQTEKKHFFHISFFHVIRFADFDVRDAIRVQLIRIFLIYITCVLHLHHF